jgi:hypothetical protein
MERKETLQDSARKKHEFMLRRWELYKAIKRERDAERAERYSK